MSNITKTKLLNMTGSEFVMKIRSGERNFSNIRLQKGFSTDNNIDGKYIGSYPLARESYYPISIWPTGILLNNYLSRVSEESFRKNSYDFSGSDFSNTYLQHLELPYLIAKNAKFTNADLYWTNFKYADFSKSDMSNAYLRRVDASYANFAGANLFKADLTDITVDSSRMIGANLQQTILKNADFSFSQFVNADLRNARNLEECIGLGTSYFLDVKIDYKQHAIIKKILAKNTQSQFNIFE